MSHEDHPQTYPSGFTESLSRGHKIEAIRLLREARGIGLKEAKEETERYIANNPELQNNIRKVQAAAAKGFFRWLVILVLTAFLIYYIWPSL